MCVCLWEILCGYMCVRVRGLVCVGQACNNYVKLSLSSINPNTSTSVWSAMTNCSILACEYTVCVCVCVCVCGQTCLCVCVCLCLYNSL